MSLTGKFLVFTLTVLFVAVAVLSACGTTPTKTLTSIEIDTMPAKLVYNIGDNLDISGGKIKVNFSNDTNEIIDMKANMISGFDSSIANEDLFLTVSYQSKTTTFKVSVRNTQNVDLNIASGGEMILISLDQSDSWKENAGAFKAFIRSSEIWDVIDNAFLTQKNAYNTLPENKNNQIGQTAFKLGYATTADGKTITTEYGTALSANQWFVHESGEGGYASFLVRVRSTSALNIILTSDSTVATPNQPTAAQIAAGASVYGNLKPLFAWNDFFSDTYGDFSILKGAKIYTSAAYGVRYSFIPDASYIPADVSKAADATGLRVWNPRLTTSGTSMSIIDSRLGLADYYVMKNTTSPDGRNFSNDYRINLLELSGIANGYKELPGVYSDTGDWGESPLLKMVEGDMGYWYGSMRVNIWLEGWDSNCTNANLDDKIISNLVFRGLV